MKTFLNVLYLLSPLLAVVLVLGLFVGFSAFISGAIQFFVTVFG